ncbi:helix-turn-helix domain-containing protein [Streptomyces sp. NBC_01429]|uniref:helix-turn-helix domain-containing protein n=1 Tax=Streptomyces sp. NBC_01429 TaxID=2903862 RepID=UPI002E2C6063|nr:helix-turn-helix domain-containing protein [Streptomyces sp. NBC_01429]
MAQTSLGEALNTTLRDAISDANMTRSKLARTVGVTSKTVERWLSDPTRVPHPETRQEVAEALGVSAEVLWPKAIRSAIKTGPEREIVAAYPYRNACPTSVWGRLIDGASTSIIFAGYTNYFVWQEHPRLAARLKAKAASGCSVRFLVGDPDSQVTRRREEIEGVPLTVGTRIRITLDALSKMGDAPGIEARFSDDHIALSVFTFDDEMLVTPHLSSLLGHESPMLHLRRLGDDGLYDRFASHVLALWEDGRTVVG